MPSDQSLYELIAAEEDRLWSIGVQPFERQRDLASNVMRSLGWDSFILSGPETPEVLTRIRALHSKFYRRNDRTRGPIHAGIYSSRGIVGKIEVPYLVGRVGFNPFELSDFTSFQLAWMCEETTHQQKYLEAFCDVFDFGCAIIPMGEAKSPSKEAQGYLGNARSQ